MAFDVKAEIQWDSGYPTTVNNAPETAFAADVAAEVVGAEAVATDAEREMGAEDFSYMLNARRGAYLFLGQGDGPYCHHPAYDFNDEISPIGASFFARLGRTRAAAQFRRGRLTALFRAGMVGRNDREQEMALEDAKREVDGAFTRKDLKGLSYENVFGGATSFMRRKYSKDLAGVDIAVTGIPFDQAVTNRPGARLGPRAIREASALQVNDPPYGWGLDPLSELAIVDYGDLAFDYGQTSDFPAALDRAYHGHPEGRGGGDFTWRRSFHFAADPAGPCREIRCPWDFCSSTPTAIFGPTTTQTGSITERYSTRQ